MSLNKDKVIVGSEEWIGLPELNIPTISCRLDSGVKTSSLHTFNVQKFKRNDQLWVSFEVHPIQQTRATVIRSN